MLEARVSARAGCGKSARPVRRGERGFFTLPLLLYRFLSWSLLSSFCSSAAVSGCAKHAGARGRDGSARTGLFRELPADRSRSIQLIHCLENLQLHILVEGRRSQVLVHLSLGRRRLLPLDKRVQPSHQKEYLTMKLDLGQRLQGGPQTRLGQRRLVPVVKLAQALGDPIFRALGIAQVIVEMNCLVLASGRAASAA